MYKTKNEIEKWLKAFNSEQVERIMADNYLDYIDENDLDGFERFRDNGAWPLNLLLHKHYLIYYPNGKVKIGGK